MPPKNFIAKVHFRNEASDNLLTASASADIDDLDFKIDFNLVIEEGRVYIKTAGNYKEITLEFEQTTSYLINDKIWEFKITQHSSIPSINWANSFEQATTLTKKHFKTETNGNFNKYNIMKKILWNYGKDFMAEESLTSEDGESLLKSILEVKKNSPTFYTWKVNFFLIKCIYLGYLMCRVSGIKNGYRC